MTNLTDKWEKGELPEGDYYIKRRNGDTPYDNIDSHGVWRNSIDEDIIEVLEPVPSYEEWDKLNNACHELEKETACLTVDNVNLKKWCEEFNALDVANENEALKTKLSIQCGANEELRKACKMRDKVIKKYEDIDAWWKKENTKLKELLEEANNWLKAFYAYEQSDFVRKQVKQCLTKINQVLGEE